MIFFYFESVFVDKNKLIESLTKRLPRTHKKSCPFVHLSRILNSINRYAIHFFVIIKIIITKAQVEWLNDIRHIVIVIFHLPTRE